jgi:hypothetical protein
VKSIKDGVKACTDWRISMETDSDFPVPASMVGEVGHGYIGNATYGRRFALHDLFWAFQQLLAFLIANTRGNLDFDHLAVTPQS